MTDSKTPVRNDFHPIKGPRSFHNCKSQTRVVTTVEGQEVEQFKLRPGKTAHDKATGSWKSKEHRRQEHLARQDALTHSGGKRK